MRRLVSRVLVNYCQTPSGHDMGMVVKTRGLMRGTRPDWPPARHFALCARTAGPARCVGFECRW